MRRLMSSIPCLSTHHTSAWLAAATLALLTAACSTLPGGAPVSTDILAEARSENPGFAFYPVSRAFLPSVTHWPETGTHQQLSWLPTAQGPKSQIIQPGDILNIRVWDSTENSLLTAPGQRVANLQGMKVSSEGAIFLPYVGQVNLLGHTPEHARETLQNALEVVVPSAQVQLVMEEGRNNSVDLVSGVAKPGIYPMPDRNFTVMGLISAGGGIGRTIQNPQIRLMRGGRLYGTSVETLLNTPGLDTLLRGGDRVFVEEDERYFLSFGATGRQDLHYFPKDRLSAMDAISITGGLREHSADAKGILVMREYRPSDIAPGQRGPRQERVIFSLDLTTTDGLFSARQFDIHPQDLVIATEAPINDVVTVASIVGNFAGIFDTIDNIGQ